MMWPRSLAAGSSFLLAASAAALLLLSACAPPQVEPAFSDVVPVTRTLQSTPPVSPLPQALSTEPNESDRATPTPPPTPNLTTTPWDPTQPQPTPTPVPPPPGLIYQASDGLWQVADDWQPVHLTERSGIIISPDGQQGLYQEGDDIWLLELVSGETRNLTGGSGRVACCPQWWPAQPGAIVFGSWPPDSELGPSTGYLSIMYVDGSNLTVLDGEAPQNALPAPSPDGLAIAYDRTGSAWLYRQGTAEPLDPAAYGLENITRIGGPSWSPDSQQLAWTVAVTDPEWRIALAVFDLNQPEARLLHPYENIGRGGWFPAPVWSPDSRWLAFVAEAADPAGRGVWVVAADGSVEVFLGNGTSPTWSPDNRWLVYSGIEEATSGYELNTRLVEVASWYTIQMHLPPGATVVGWTSPEA